MAVDTLPVIPGWTAIGHGGETLNICRDREPNMLKVSTTNATGAGSLSSAIQNLDNTKFNFIIFTTGGTASIGAVSVDSFTLNATHSCVYLAAQTAPGGGYALHTPRDGRSTFRIEGANDVVIRFLRFRSANRGDAQQLDAFDFREGQNLLVAQNSMSWGSDEIFSMTPVSADSLTDWTVAYNYFCCGFKTMSLVSLSTGDGPIHRGTLLQNTMQQASHRFPTIAQDDGGALGGVQIELVGNVFGGAWGSKYSHYWGGAQTDWLDNGWVKMAASTGGDIIEVRECTSPVESPPCGGRDERYAGQLYVDGNTTVGITPILTDSSLIELKTSGPNAPPPDSIFRGTRLAALNSAVFPVGRITMDSLKADTIVAFAGAHTGLNCDGTFKADGSMRDATDSLMLVQYRARTGLGATPDSIAEYGGLATLASGSACADLDDDGYPDAAEKRLLNSSTDSTSLTVDSVTAGGYWAFELYLQGKTLNFSQTSTCGGGHFIYWSTLQEDTLPKFTAGVLDSTIVQRPSTDSVSATVEKSSLLYNSDSTIVMVATKTEQAHTALDSVAADSIATANSLQIDLSVCANLLP